MLDYCIVAISLNIIFSLRSTGIFTQTPASKVKNIVYLEIDNIQTISKVYLKSSFLFQQKCTECKHFLL